MSDEPICLTCAGEGSRWDPSLLAWTPCPACARTDTALPMTFAIEGFDGGDAPGVRDVLDGASLRTTHTLDGRRKPEGHVRPDPWHFAGHRKSVKPPTVRTRKPAFKADGSPVPAPSVWDSLHLGTRRTATEPRVSRRQKRALRGDS